MGITLFKKFVLKYTYRAAYQAMLDLFAKTRRNVILFTCALIYLRCNMLKIGALIVYGAEGVCRVEDIKSLSFAGLEEKEYYILVPELNSSSKLYLPMDNEKLMSRVQRLLSYEEITELINSDEEIIEWVEDSKLRNKYYKEILSSYDRKKIFALAKQLYLIKTGKLAVKKAFTSWMDDILKKTSQILFSEFSYVVEITQDDLLPFIAGEIKCEEKKRAIKR